MPLFSPVSAGTPQNALFGVVRHNSVRYGIPIGIGVDSSGNIYIGSAWQPDITVTKFTSTGTEVWSKRLTTSNTLYGVGFHTDSSGNSYISAAQVISSTARPTMIKLDTSGNTVWQKIWAGGVEAHGSHLDSSNNLYVTGNTTAGETAGYLVKVDSNGNRVLAAFRTTTGQYQSFYSITADSAQNIITVGDGGGSDNGQIVKFNSSGTFQWRKNTDGKGRGVATDSSNNIYYGSYVSELIGGSFNVKRPVLIKYDTNGTILWTRKIMIGAPGTSPSSDVKVDSSNNIYFATVINGGYENGQNNTYLINKYNASGGLLWSRKIISSQTFPSFGGYPILMPPFLTLDSSGNLYVAGSSGYWDNSATNTANRPFFVKFPADGTRNGTAVISDRDIAVVTNTNIVEIAHTSTDGSQAVAYGSPAQTVDNSTAITNNASITTVNTIAF